MGEMEHADLRFALGAAVHGLDDFHQMADVGLGVGDDNGIARFVGDNRGVGGDKGGQILHQLFGLHKPDGNDLGDNFRIIGNLIGIVADLDGNIPGLRIIFVHNVQLAAMADGGQAAFVEDGIQQIHGFHAGHGVAADHTHIIARHLGVGVNEDDETGGIAQIIEHHLQRRVAKIQAQFVHIGAERARGLEQIRRDLRGGQGGGGPVFGIRRTDGAGGGFVRRGGRGVAGRRGVVIRRGGVHIRGRWRVRLIRGRGFRIGGRGVGVLIRRRIILGAGRGYESRHAQGGKSWPNQFIHYFSCCLSCINRFRMSLCGPLGMAGAGVAPDASAAAEPPPFGVGPVPELIVWPA